MSIERPNEGGEKSLSPEQPSAVPPNPDLDEALREVVRDIEFTERVKKALFDAEIGMEGMKASEMIWRLEGYRGTLPESHQKALDDLNDIAAGPPAVVPEDWDEFLDELLSDIPEELFSPSDDVKEDDDEALRQNFLQTGDAWYRFKELSKKFPKGLTEDQVKSILAKQPLGHEPEAYMKYFVLSLLLKHEAYRRAFASDFEPVRLLHRHVYFISQIAAILGVDIKEERQREATGFLSRFGGMEVAAPLNLFFDLEKLDEYKKREIAKFLDASLALILPDKDKHSSLFDQEKAIIAPCAQGEPDLMALLALAEAAGLMEEFREKFDLLMHYRRLQNHFYSMLPREVGASKDHIENSLPKLIQRLIDANEGPGPLKIVIIGPQDRFRETFLKNMFGEKIEILKMVDVTDGEQTVIELKEGAAPLVRVAGNGEERDKVVLEEALGGHGPVNLVICENVAHEAVNSRANLIRMFEMLPPGTVLDLVDPSYSWVFEGGDKSVTPLVLFGTDAGAKARGKNVARDNGIMSIEEFDTFAMLVELWGGKVLNARCMPGAYAGGCNDEMPRVVLHIQAPERSDAAAYSIPGRAQYESLPDSEMVRSFEDFYQIWPFSAIPEGQKAKFESALSEQIPTERIFGKMKKNRLVKYVLRELYIKHGPDARVPDRSQAYLDMETNAKQKVNSSLRTRRDKELPVHPHVLGQLRKVFPNSGYFEHVKRAGDTILFVKWMKEYCAFDFAPIVKSHPAWANSKLL